VLLVVVALSLAASLRIRKFRHDRAGDLSSSDDRHLLEPPPSPYEPSKGFRLVDDTGEPLTRPPVSKPRLDPDRQYVFTDTSSASEDIVSSPLRHNDRWFLAQYSRRSPASKLMRRSVIVVLILLVVLILVAYYMNRHTPSGLAGSGSSVATALIAPRSMHASIASYRALPYTHSSAELVLI
jgi:hypothetical protein